ncbi:MAG: hypothetical protein RL173_1733 [Fibrobacterota bacterium]|jgi:hypothetical protein
MKFLRATTLLGTLAALTACDLTGGETKKTNSLTNSQTDATGQAAIKELGTKDAASDSVVSAMQDVPAEVGGRLEPAARQNLLNANATFKTQLAANPNDVVAGFGIAVTSLSLNIDDLSDSLLRMKNAGLIVGSDKSGGGLFKQSPTALVKSDAFSARAFSNPANAPKISQLQTMLDSKLMPAVDSAITFLTKCWNTPGFKYKFAIHIHGDTDSVAIGRADVGFALAGLRTAKAYFTWIMAQNVDCDFNGSYAWLDTLSHIDDEIGPVTDAQNAAFGNLQTLLAPGSSFLTLRAEKKAAVNAIPTELVDIANLAKEAGDYSVLHQIKMTDGVVRLQPDDNAKFAEVMDSVKVFLGGFRTFRKASRTGYEYMDSACMRDEYTYDTVTFALKVTKVPGTCWYEYPVTYPGFSVTLNVSKLITQPDHKVFLPKFTWNTAKDWATKGPFNLVKGSTVTPVLAFKDMNIESPTGMANYMEWADPTFGGAFQFANSAAVLQQLEDMDQKAVPNGPAIVPTPFF